MKERNDWKTKPVRCHRKIIFAYAKLNLRTSSDSENMFPIEVEGARNLKWLWWNVFSDGWLETDAEPSAFCVQFTFALSLDKDERKTFRNVYKKIFFSFQIA